MHPPKLHWMERQPSRYGRVLGRVGAMAAVLGACALPTMAQTITSGDGTPFIGTQSGKTSFAYGTYSGGIFSLDTGEIVLTPDGTVRVPTPGTYAVTGPDNNPASGATYSLGTQSFDTGGILGDSKVYNVGPVDSYDLPFQYKDLTDFGLNTGANWVSAYIDKGLDPSPGGDHSYFNEPGRVGQLMPGVFAYTTTFTVNPGLSSFDLLGNMLSDDAIVGAFVDYNFTPGPAGRISGGSVGGSTKNVSISQSTNGTDPFRVLGSFSAAGISNTPGQTHTLTFFIQNNNNDRTGIEFAANAIVPEPGTIASGLTMGMSLFGMLGAARLRRRRSAF